MNLSPLAFPPLCVFFFFFFFFRPRLKGVDAYTWLEVDVASGAVLSNSSYPAAEVYGTLPLAMPVVVGH